MGVTTRGLADMMGVTPQTIRGWVRAGKIPCHTGPAGRSFFTDEDINEILNNKSNAPQVWAHYTRSNAGLNSALANQQDRLAEHYGQAAHVIKDKGSGLNEKRKGLQKLLNLAKDGEITDIAITSKDRLTRFGYTYLERYFTDNGINIHVLDGDTEKAPEQELIDDFMALLASFAGRYYHLRSKTNEQKFLNKVESTLSYDEQQDR